MALKGVDEAMNDQDLKTLRMCQQIPLKAMESRRSAGAVKDLMVRTEVVLKTAKRWLFSRNLMVTVCDPESLDMRDPDVASEMIV